ncbi:Homoserine O-succinyltransferase [Elusimicrobium minutum Pei191]|uniref:Homoserine O-acetyltransferase n=1 Tax=Elusimicrobium minutum (strain Pei191) TaxID=445932 RepID=B2KBU2_ELUMP|nr:homoserine O-succinyltransferase [Elusimicrobium minutum]ACC97846.1 Homoserine O-succinyltransferase [Elusimicrobium minutum Pei191]
MIEACVLNLMPTKEATERQLSSLLNSAGKKINIAWLTTATYKSKNISEDYLRTNYITFENITNRKFDIFIVTGAPVELMEFEDVAYWQELTKILDFTKTNSLFNIFICWGAQAALYHFYKIQKYKFDKKYCGIFKQSLQNPDSIFYKEIADGFYMPHSRHTGIKKEDIKKNKNIITDLCSGVEVSVVSSSDQKNLYITGHPEYEADTIHLEYLRDLASGKNPALPENYYPENNPALKPVNTWQKQAAQFYKNIINHVINLKGELNENF